MSALPPPVSPVTPQCVVQAADMERVPVAAVVAIMRAEGGHVGRSHRNSNGTRDYGPMQINSAWLPQLKQAGISAQMLRNNGCINVLVGSWILKQAMVETPRQLWSAIGHYHSHTRGLAEAYEKRVWHKMTHIHSIRKAVDYANNR